jgi:hypothetical protein
MGRNRREPYKPECFAALEIGPSEVGRPEPKPGALLCRACTKNAHSYVYHENPRSRPLNSKEPTMRRAALALIAATIVALITAAGFVRAATPDCTVDQCIYLPLIQKAGSPGGAPKPTMTTTATATPARTSTPTITVGISPTPTDTPTGTPTTTVTPTRTRTPSPTATPTRDPNQCAIEYPTVCIPPPPPDLNCPDITYRNFTVLQPDRHRFDGNNDGIGCET